MGKRTNIRDWELATVVADAKGCDYRTVTRATRLGLLDGQRVGTSMVVKRNAKMRRWKPNAVAQRVRRGVPGKSLRNEVTSNPEGATTQPANDLFSADPDWVMSEQALAVIPPARRGEIAAATARCLSTVQRNDELPRMNLRQLKELELTNPTEAARISAAIERAFAPYVEFFGKYGADLQAILKENERLCKENERLQLFQQRIPQTATAKRTPRTGKTPAKTRAGGRGNAKKARAPNGDGDADPDSSAPAVRRRKLSSSTSSALIEARPRLCALACLVLLLWGGGSCAA